MQPYTDPNLAATAVCLAVYILRTILMLVCAFAMAVGAPIGHDSSLACNVQLTVFGHVWLVSFFLAIAER